MSKSLASSCDWLKGEDREVTEVVHHVSLLFEAERGYLMRQYLYKRVQPLSLAILDEFWDDELAGPMGMRTREIFPQVVPSSRRRGSPPE